MNSIHSDRADFKQYQLNVGEYERVKTKLSELSEIKKRRVNVIGFILWCLIHPIVTLLLTVYNQSFSLRYIFYAFLAAILFAVIASDSDTEYIVNSLSFGSLAKINKQLSESEIEKEVCLAKLKLFEKPLCDYNKIQLQEFLERRLFNKRAGSQQFEDDLSEFSAMVELQSEMNGNLITERVYLREYIDYLDKRLVNHGKAKSKTKEVRQHSLKLQRLPRIISEKAIPPEQQYRVARKIDNWDEINQRRRINGQKGEEIVLALEKDFLESANRKDLSDKVRHVSVEDGDGLGYDILSFFEDGREKYIEVKSTTSSIESPYLISRNELSFLTEHLDDAFICRVAISDNEPKIEVRNGHEVTKSDMVPMQYLVQMN